MTPSERPSRFAIGDRVLIDDRAPLGHCRTPWYLRGKTGVVSHIQGPMHDPEKMAYYKPGLPEVVHYKVRFRQSDLWSGYTGPASDNLEADLPENWLKPIR